jgi:8-oxo-dGTP pyrophosphatase MutT (NUDIX family)
MVETDIVQKAILRNVDNKILLLRRSETDTRRPLQWDFPGGMLDEDEGLDVGIWREIHEESGINATKLRPIFSKTEFEEWVDNNGEHTSNVIRIYYVAKTEDDTVTLSYEHSEFCWVTLEEALAILEYDRHKEVLTYIIEKNLNLEA